MEIVVYARDGRRGLRIGTPPEQDEKNEPRQEVVAERGPGATLGGLPL